MIDRSIHAILIGAILCAVPAAAQQSAPKETGHRQAVHGHGAMEDARSALRLVAVHQMRYRAETGRYAASLRELGLEAPESIDIRITANGADGFAAISAAATEECAIFSGRTSSPRAYVNRPNELRCRGRDHDG